MRNKAKEDCRPFDECNEHETDKESLRKSTSNKERQCKYCGRLLNKTSDISQHESKCKRATTNADNVIIKDEENRFICNICFKKFKFLAGLSKHKLRHEEPGGFICKLCDSRYCTDQELQKHKEVTHMAYKCQICKTTFNNKDIYIKHIINDHDGRDREYAMCENCGELFKTRTILTFHKQSLCGTLKPFKCNICGSLFQNQFTLKNHLLIHKGEKQFCCSFCGNSFLSKGQLVVHERKHTKEKPYECSICSKAFAHRESLVTHSSVHTGIKPYLCKGCGACFSCIGNLQKHRRHRPNTCGLPQYNQNVKAAPRPSMKRSRLTSKTVKITKANMVIAVYTEKENLKNGFKLHGSRSKSTEDINLEENIFNEKLECKSSDYVNPTINQVKISESPEKERDNSIPDPPDSDPKLDEDNLVQDVIDTSISSSDCKFEIDDEDENEIEKGEAKLEKETVNLNLKTKENTNNDNDEENIPLAILRFNLISKQLNRKHYNERHSTDLPRIEEMDTRNLKSKYRKKRVKLFEMKAQTYECNKCPKIYHQRKPYVKHLVNDHGMNVVDVEKSLDLMEANGTNTRCKYCAKVYYQQASLKKHESLHGPGGKFLHKCPCCQRYFQTVEKANEHAMKSHANSLICEVCQKVYSGPEGLNAHKRYAHQSKNANKLEKKAHVCQKCGKKFVNKTALNDHERSDCGQQPLYKCGTCGKRYHSAGSLKIHETIHTGNLPYKCSYCVKSFRTYGQVKVHERTHSGEKPFKCDVCNKAFSYRESLITHSSLHTGVRRYTCYGCDMRFSCISNLQNHRRTHKDTCGALPLCSKAANSVGVSRGVLYVGPKID